MTTCAKVLEAKAITKAMAEPRQIARDLVDAESSRQHPDHWEPIA